MGAKYEVNDNSVLTPMFKRWVWSPLVGRIPDRVSANTLTILGTVLSASAFGITALFPASRLTCAVAAVLIFIYLTLDNIDGAHARRTGTSSPLGEFLDHWLDALNLSFLFVGAIHTWRIQDDRAVLVMMVAVWSYTMTFWEQKVTSRINLAAVGNVEGIFVVVLFYLAGAIFGPETLISTPLIFGQTVIDLFWYTAICSVTYTTVMPLLRVRGNWKEVAEIFGPVIALGLWYRYGELSAISVCNVLMLMSPALAGRMLISRVTDQDQLGPDRFLQGAIYVAAPAMILMDMGGGVQQAALGLILAYAILHVSLDFVMTVRRLGDYLRPGELLDFARLRPRS
jgi:phosphatidylglycerophosphate synthase